MAATSLLSSLLNHSPERHIYMAQLKEPSPSCPPQTNTATPSKIPNPLQDSKTSVAYMTVTHVNMVQAPANGAAMSSPENDADGIAPSALTTTAMTVGSELMVAGILLLFVVLALAVVLYKYAAIRRRSRGDGQTTANGRLGTAVAGAGSEGIDLEVLQSLPITAYRAKDFEEAVDCAVCLAELADGEAARFLPMCGHGFHAECIDMWLHSRSTCPLCRLAVGKPDVSLPPPLALPPASPEPANYTTSLPATVLFWGSQGAVTATADGSSSPSSDTAVLVIEIPELAVLAPHDAVRSPGSARLRSLRRLWGRGRQGADTSSCSCSSAGAGDDIEQATGTGICVCVVQASRETTSGANPRTR